MEYSNDSNQEKNYFDRWMISASILFIFLLSAILYSNQLSNFLFGRHNEDNNRPSIAKVTDIKNDVRYKFADTFSWLDAEKTQNLRLGDALFTGANSETQVVFQNGDSMTIGEKSIVLFSQVEGIDTPQLHQGEIKLNINGKRKIILNGQIAEFEGKNSQIQVSFDGGKKPKVKLLKGNVTTLHEGLKKPVSLATSQDILLDLQPAPSIRQTASIQEVPPSKIEPEVSESFYKYNFKLYDIYENENQVLKRRQDLPTAVKIKVPLHWKVEGTVDKIFIQVSNSESFSELIQSFETIGSFYELQKGFIGDNYWKISLDQQKWAAVNRFNLQADFISTPPPNLKIHSDQYLLYQLDDFVQVKGLIEDNSELSHFIIESSEDPDFAFDKTQVTWQSTKDFIFQTDHLGIIYIRARGVNSQLELTIYSSTSKITIVKPELPQPPILATREFKRPINETLNLNWKSSQSISKYKTEILDSKGKVIFNQLSERPGFEWRSSESGLYQAKIFSVDRWGRKSSQSSDLKIEITPQIPVLAKNQDPLPKTEETPPKANSTTDQQINKVDEKVAMTQTTHSTSITKSTTHEYKTGTLQIEGAGFGMYSSQQMAYGSESAMALIMGARATKWWNDNGIEGSIKTKLLDLNQESKSISPLQAEVRYHRRWTLPFNFFSSIHQSQLSLIGGYEVYRSGASGSSTYLYAPQYSLFKAGFATTFPVSKQWETGGEALLGFGTDSSTKYEISGFLNYFVKRNWSFGFGYRMHLFEGGLDSSPPDSAPFREGYGEGFSSLRWHY